MAKMNSTATCGARCPLQRTLSVIEGKYTPFILKELFGGAKRFGQIQKGVGGISRKTLADKLKYLVGQGIVARVAYPEKPPKVVYSLTARGAKLEKIMLDLQNFWEEADASLVRHSDDTHRAAEPEAPLETMHAATQRRRSSVHPLIYPLP